MDAQKIAVLKANTPESLTSFLAGLPGTFEAQLFYAVVIFGLLGMLANYTRRWLQDDTGGWHFFAYLFREYPKRTMLSIFTTLATGVGMIASGVFETATGEFVGWMNVIVVTFNNGFTFDAITNKGKTDPEATVPPKTQS